MSPDFETFQSHAANGNVVPVSKILSADLENARAFLASEPVASLAAALE